MVKKDKNSIGVTEIETLFEVILGIDIDIDVERIGFNNYSSCEEVEKESGKEIPDFFHSHSNSLGFLSDLFSVSQFLKLHFLKLKNRALDTVSPPPWC